MEKYTTFRHQFTVEEKDTAESNGSGGLPVLATPAMIGYMEKTAYLMLQGPLDSDEDGDKTSVGVEINVKHLAPTPVGKKVSVKATLLEASQKIFTLQVEAFAGGELIGEGTNKRVVVDVEEFMGKVK